MSKEIESLIKKFNQGSLADFTELELYIESGEIKLEELTGLDKYYNKIEQIPVPEASPRLKPNFYKMLAKEQSKGLNWNFFSGLNTWIESCRIPIFNS